MVGHLRHHPALARAAQSRRVPYNLSIVAGFSIEEAAKNAPDVFWLQLYRFPRNEHAIGFDLARRAEAVGAKALVITLDVPVRTTRSREVASGITYPFRVGPRMAMSAMTSPGYLMALWRTGITRLLVPDRPCAACSKPSFWISAITTLAPASARAVAMVRGVLMRLPS